jgi:hypothetical protein
MKASKIAYTPVGLALGAVSGMAAGAAFKEGWKVVGHDADAPDATDEGRSWGEVLLAACETPSTRESRTEGSGTATGRRRSVFAGHSSALQHRGLPRRPGAERSGASARDGWGTHRGKPKQPR